MSVQVTEDFVSVLAREVIAKSIIDDASQSYPQVPLELGSVEKEHQLHLIWLANPYLRVAVCPQLGGRIMAIDDLRTGTEILRLPDRLNLVDGGIRGVEGLFGIEFLAGAARRNSLGMVDYRVIEAATDESKAAVMLFELDGDLSWHGVVTLPPDRAVIIIEQKIQNRSWYSNICRSGIVIRELDSGGLNIIDSEHALGWRQNGEYATLPISGRMGGRRIDDWRVELVPHSEIGELLCGNESLSIGVTASQLGIQTSGDTSGYRVFLQCAGQTLESSVNQKVGSITFTDLSQFAGNIEGVAVKNGNGQVVAQWPVLPIVVKEKKFEFPYNEFDILFDQMDDLGNDIERMMGMEAMLYELEAVGRVRTQEWERADEAMEKFLAYHAEDALGWWLRASIKRERGLERSDEDRELSNAHFLMPLDPLLKAEAFLNTPIAEGREANPLLTSIAHDPGVASMVVEMYHRCWLRQGMVRLAEELIQHRENATIHYFLADAYLSNQRLVASAAQHVISAEKLPIEPPFPYRRGEVDVIERLYDRFPDSARLNQLVKLIETAREKGYLRRSSQG